MVPKFSHIYHILTVNTDASWGVKFSIATALPPKFPQKLSLCCEHLNAMVLSVSYMYIPSAVKCHIPGVVKLSIVTAMAAEAAGECQVRVQNLNTVIVIISYIQFSVVWMDCNTYRCSQIRVAY